jgi:hypothetical protein
MPRISSVLLVLGVAFRSALALAPNAFDQPLAVFFLHLRKCGGTSLGAYLRGWLGRRGCCPPHAPCRPAPRWMASTDAAATWWCRGPPNASLHFAESEYHCLSPSFAALPAFPAASRVLAVTVLRHPIDRYGSYH